MNDSILINNDYCTQLYIKKQLVFSSLAAQKERGFPLIYGAQNGLSQLHANTNAHGL